MTISSIIKLIVAKDFSALNAQDIGYVPLDRSDLITDFKYNTRVYEGEHDFGFYGSFYSKSVLKRAIPYYISKLGSLL